MTRDDFFGDLNELVRLLGQLGLASALQVEAAQKVATLKTSGHGMTSDDLRRYGDAIDWIRTDNVQALRDLARVLLRIVAGLATELESFRRVRG
jgi:hypothetical protein